MKFKRASFMLVVGIALLAAAFALSDKSPTALASSPTVWLDGVPNLHRIDDGSSQLSGDPNIDCTQMSIPVVRYIGDMVATPKESHCMNMTPGGLMDNLMTVVLPAGFNKAYPISKKPPGNGSIRVIPNQGSALYMNYGSPGVGEYIALYRGLASHFSYHFDPQTLSPNLSISNPDFYFKYPNGQQISFMPYVAFSNNGNYMIGEAKGYGFIRIDLNTLQMKIIARDTMQDSSGEFRGAEVAISPSGKYAAIAYSANGWGSSYLKIVDVDSCGDAVQPYDARTTTCKSYDYWPKLADSIPNLTFITGVQFASDNSLNFLATIGRFSDHVTARYEMSPAGQPTRLEEYLAMGDSFASGEGTFDYIAPTDTNPNKCHTSIYSYPFLMQAKIGSTESVACSSAVMRNVEGDPNKQKSNQLKDILDSEIPITQQGIAKSSHIPGVVRQLDFIGRDNPQVVTISIGGNDFGFSSIIKRCIVPFNYGSSTSQNCYQTYEDRKELVDVINSKYNELVKTYTDVKSNDPTRRVYVIGYPQVVSDSGSCGLNVRMSQSDRQFAALLASYMDSVVERAAAEAGVSYVDTQHAFDGHKLCEDGTKAVNGLTAGNDNGIVGNESYHPTRLGHELLADTILAGTQNLTAPMPASHIIPVPDESGLEFLQAPHTGRTMYNIVNGAKDILFALSGGIINLSSDSYKNIIQPGGIFNVILHSTPTNLGTVSADQDGVTHGSLPIPAGTEPGFHTVHMYGKNKFGEPIDIQQTVFVAASVSDYDGDGVLNSVDTCQTIPNSGQDQDQDGIDDACDPEIGPAPVPAPTQDNDQSSAEPGKGADVSTTKTEDTLPKTPQITPKFTLVNVKSIANIPKETAIFFGQIKGAATAVSTPTTPVTPKAKTSTKPTATPAKQPQNNDHTTTLGSITFSTIVSSLLIGIGAACIGGYALKRFTSSR